ncbi:MAG: DMT family transporter [Alphaproteobacteria bacterium]
MSDRHLGIFLALLSATMLGLAVAISRFAYDGGTNGLTVASLRSVVAVGWLFAFCVLTGRSLRPPPGMYPHLFGLGLLMLMMFYGNVGAVEFISIPLAALLFFTFPPVIALINGLVLRFPVGPVRYGAVAVAFVGIALMLGVSFAAAVDPLGVILALSASICTAINGVWMGQKVAGKIDTWVATLHMAAVACAALLLISVPSGALQLPATTGGWAGMFGVAILQASGFPLYYLAIVRIGALNCAMFGNIQPVASIVAGFALFGDLLTGFQFAGGALVLAGIIILQWQDRREART